MTNNFFDYVTEWQDATFGTATALSKITHLAKELEELVVDIATNGPEKSLEWADCFILLFGAAHSDGMSYDDINDAIYRKMQINKARKWGPVNQDGTVNHIKE